MKLIKPVTAFNTKRLYTEEGQPISYAIIRRDDHKTIVVFRDHARGIEGVIDVHFGNTDLVTNDWVLRAYDDMHYHHLSLVERDFFDGLFL
jgi:hypothetical protein